MSFGRRPDHTFAPGHEFTKFRHLRVAGIDTVVNKRQPRRVEETHLGAEPLKDPPALFRREAGKTPVTKRSVKDQNPWRVLAVS